MANTLCTTCGAELCNDGTCVSWKCEPAKNQSFRTRLSRALKTFKDGKEPSILVDFNKLSEEDKAKFKKDHHSALGDHLKMAIVNRVNVIRKTEVINKAVAKGHMKDKHDLTEKYGKKPEQLSAIFANAHSFTCPIRNCKL